MEGQRPYWNMDIESKLNTPETKEIQWAKLKGKIEHLYHVAPFWKSWMDKAGAQPGNIRTWDDFHKRMPVFAKDDYRRFAEECDGNMERILEGLLGTDVERLICLAATSGTTGEPSPYPFVPEDRVSWSEYLKRAFWRCGVYPGDKVLHGFGLSMVIAGVPVCFGISDYGACCIPVGAEAGTEALLKFARLFKPTAMISTPSLAEYLIQKAKEITGEGVDALNIKRLFCGGEPGAGIPEVRQKIEGAFKAHLHDFGGGGVSCEYPEYQGMHFVLDDYLLLELVDPETHEHIPLEDGAKGLIVHTQLDRSLGWAGMRSTTNDINQVFTSPCPCGKTGLRYKIVGRVDDMLKVKGTMVYPPAIEGVINSFVPRVTGEFRIILDEPPPRVVPPLKIKVEYGESVKEDELEPLAEEIAETMHRRIKVRPKVIWIASNTLERFVKKKNLFEKAYKK